MVSSRDLLSRRLPDAIAASAEPDETLISDRRGEMTPAEMVQEKLGRLLWGRSASVPPSARLPHSRRVFDSGHEQRLND